MDSVQSVEYRVRIHFPAFAVISGANLFRSNKSSNASPSTSRRGNAEGFSSLSQSEGSCWREERERQSSIRRSCQIGNTLCLGCLGEVFLKSSAKWLLSFWEFWHFTTKLFSFLNTCLRYLQYPVLIHRNMKSPDRRSLCAGRQVGRGLRWHPHVN